MSPRIAEALKRVVTDLTTAHELLAEVYSTGLWSRSDGDNRRIRQALRETDWTISGAHRALRELSDVEPALPEPIEALKRELQALVARIEPLPNEVTDTMPDQHLWLDVEVMQISDEATRLREQAARLRAE